MKKRRIDLLKKKNSKIVLVDTIESEALVDLSIKTNEIFLKLRKSAGVSIDYETVDNTIKIWSEIMIKTSQSLEKIAGKIEIEYTEPASISILRNKMENE